MAQFSQSFWTAHGVVHGQVSKLRNRYTAAVVEQVATEARSAGSVAVMVFAERVSHLTLAVVQQKALKACSTGTGGIMSSAMIRNNHAYIVGVEYPSFRALLAHLVIPVPKGTANITNFLNGSL